MISMTYRTPRDHGRPHRGVNDFNDLQNTAGNHGQPRDHGKTANKCYCNSIFCYYISHMKHLLLCTCILSGCAQAVTGSAVEGVKPIQAKDVQNCQFVTDVTGLSPLYGILAAQALADARAAAFRSAKEMGANAFLVRQTNATYGSTSVTGDAYKCPGP